MIMVDHHHTSTGTLGASDFKGALCLANSFIAHSTEKAREGRREGMLLGAGGYCVVTD